MAYYGWTNYETWCMALHMGNDEPLQRCFERAAVEAVQDVGVGDAVPVLADRLEEWHKDAMPEVSGVFADLLNAAMSEVNWYEIARHYIEAVQEESNA
jgi:hypothetical protein